MKKCKKCGNRFFGGAMVYDYCGTCRKQPEVIHQQQAEQQEKTKNLACSIGEKQFPQLNEGKETVVLLVEGDAGLQLAIQCANALGYELMHTSSAMSIWTPFTKYTLIFKKK